MVTLLLVGFVALVVVLAALRSFHSDRTVRGRPGHQAPRPQARRRPARRARTARPATRPTLLMPGLRFKLWPLFKVERYPWVQVPPDHIGLVIAQVGDARADRRQVGGLPARVRQLRRPAQPSWPTAASAACSGPCCPRAPPLPIHPVGFVVITSDRDLRQADLRHRPCRRRARSIRPRCGSPTSPPRATSDIVGVVTTLEGPPSGDIASRIGGFSDVTAMEAVGSRLRRSRSSRRCCAPRTTCTTTTRTTRRSSTTAAASASSTTRCCTARTCSTRSW